MKNKITNIICIFLVLFVSCKKENYNTDLDSNTPEGHVKLSFEIDIENDLFNTTSISDETQYLDDYKLANSVNQNSTNTITTSDIYSHKDFDYRVQFEEPNTTKIVSNDIKLQASNSPISNTNKAVVRMANGIKYIVFIYDLDDNLIMQKTLTSGGTSATNDNTIILRGGVRYKYKAISYNTTTAPTVTIVNSQPVVASLNNDLLYTSGTTAELPFNTQGNTTPNQNTVKQGIVFSHQTAKLDVAFQFTGLMGTFAGGGISHGINISVSSDANSDINPFTTGSFNVFTGQYDPNSHTPHPQAFYYKREYGGANTDEYPGWIITTGAPWTYNDRGMTSIYTSKSMSIPALYLRIKEYKFYKTIIAGTPSEFAELNTASGPIPLKYSTPFDMEIGELKKIEYQLIEPAVTIPGLPDIQFARGNLMHKGAQTYLSIRFGGYHQDVNTINREVGSYNRWRQNELKTERHSMYQYLSEASFPATPLTSFLFSYNVPSVDKGDPCKRMFPLGAWTTPSPSQLELLANYINSNLGTIDVKGSHLLFPETTSTLPLLSSITHNRLILERNGYGEFIPGSPITQDYQTRNFLTDRQQDSYGYYWSSTPGKYLLIKGLTSNNNVTASIETTTATEDTMYIRCVRAQQ